MGRVADAGVGEVWVWAAIWVDEKLRLFVTRLLVEFFQAFYT